MVGPHLTVLVPLPTYPTLFPLPQPAQHARASGRVLSGHRLGTGSPGCGVTVGVSGSQALRPALVGPSLLFPPGNCP